MFGIYLPPLLGAFISSSSDESLCSSSLALSSGLVVGSGKGFFYFLAIGAFLRGYIFGLKLLKAKANGWIIGGA